MGQDKFIVYNENGNILRTGSCPRDMVSIQAQLGESVVRGDGNDRDHKVVDGQIVKKSKAEMNALVASEKTFEDVQDRLRIIRSKGQEILDAMAIKELTKEGIWN